MPKVIKITESDLKRIIIERIKGDTNEQIKPLIKDLVKGVQGFFGGAKETKGVARGFATQSKAGSQYYKEVVSSMRGDVSSFLKMKPVIKMTPKNVKSFMEPLFNVKLALRHSKELEAQLGSHMVTRYLEKSFIELSKPVGQDIQLKSLMEDLYRTKDEIAQSYLTTKAERYVANKGKIQEIGREVDIAIKDIESKLKTAEKPDYIRE